MKRIDRRGFLKRSGIWVASGLALPWLTSRRLIEGTLAPDPSAPGAVAAGVSGPAVAAFELQTPHQVLQMDVSYTTYVTRFNQLYNQGYRPVWVQGSTNSAAPATFSGIWVRDGNNNFYGWINMTTTDYQNNFSLYLGQGYRPISVSGYQDNGANRFAAIWLYAPTVAYDGVHNDTNAQYQSFVTAEDTKHYIPQVVDGYAVGTNPTASDEFISIFANVPSVLWLARHGMTSSDYSSYFTTYANAGYHVTSLSAYQINGVTYFAAYWIKDSVNDWYGRHDWTPSALFSQAVTFEQADYQPTCLLYTSPSPRD